MSPATENPAATPWWLSGEETCGFCLCRYAYEVEYRCVACDQAVCPQCIVVVEAQIDVLCPECAEAEGHGEPDPVGEPGS